MCDSTQSKSLSFGQSLDWADISPAFPNSGAGSALAWRFPVTHEIEIEKLSNLEFDPIDTSIAQGIWTFEVPAMSLLDPHYWRLPSPKIIAGGTIPLTSVPASCLESQGPNPSVNDILGSSHKIQNDGPV
jgi:hypothetical protein